MGELWTGDTGKWKCRGCGAIHTPETLDPGWRWEGKRWAHHCPDMHPQVGHTWADRLEPMAVLDIIEAVFAELGRAEEKFPGWPGDVVHQAAIVVEEAGELMQAALDLYYGRAGVAEFKQEATQTTAMGLRLLIHLEKYGHIETEAHRKAKEREP